MVFGKFSNRLIVKLFVGSYCLGASHLKNDIQQY